MEIFAFVFATYGLTGIIVDGSIFYKFRVTMANISETLGTLFSCYRCFGFWAGVLVGCFIPMFATDLGLCEIVLHGFIGSGTSWILAMLSSYLEKPEETLMD